MPPTSNTSATWFCALATFPFLISPNESHGSLREGLQAAFSTYQSWLSSVCSHVRTSTPPRISTLSSRQPVCSKRANLFLWTSLTKGDFFLSPLESPSLKLHYGQRLTEKEKHGRVSSDPKDKETQSSLGPWRGTE